MTSPDDSTPFPEDALPGDAKTTAREWIDAHLDELAEWHTHIWELAEPAWREYRSKPGM